MEEGDRGKRERLIDTKRGPKPVDESSAVGDLYSEIGRFKMENDGLKKIGAISRDERMDWIEPEHAGLPLTRQCELAGVLPYQYISLSSQISSEPRAVNAVSYPF